MAEKFTFEKHQERMRKILAQVEPVERPNVIRSLLERIRGKGTQPATPLPRLPKLPRSPGV